MNDSRIARESIRISCQSIQYWHDYMRCKIEEKRGDNKFEKRNERAGGEEEVQKCGCCDIQWGIMCDYIVCWFGESTEKTQIKLCHI